MQNKAFFNVVEDSGKKKSEGKTPTYITPDLNYNRSCQLFPIPHMHLASSSAFAFIPLHHHQPFVGGVVFVWWVGFVFFFPFFYIFNCN